MQLPSSCLGVLSLRRGSFVIGLVLLVLHSLSAIGCIVTWIVLSASHKSFAATVGRFPSPHGGVITIYSSPPASVLPLIFAPALVAVALHLLFSVLLMAGARLERPCLLLTWLVYQGVTLVLSLGGAATTLVLALYRSDYALLAAVFGCLGWAVIMAYCFVVVLAFLRELRRAPPALSAVARQPDMVKMEDIA